MPNEIEVSRISVGMDLNNSDLQSKADESVEALENIVEAADKAKPEIKPKYDTRPLNNAQNAFEKLNQGFTVTKGILADLLIKSM